jgi:hypothetical protein
MKVSEASLATPCDADFAAMVPLGRRARLCEQCTKVVHDLSSMTESEARTLLRRPRNGDLCIRYLHDIHGNVWFGESPRSRTVPATRLARRGLAALAGAAAIAAVPALLEACGGASPGPNPYGVAPDDAGDGTDAAPPAMVPRGQVRPAQPTVGSPSSVAGDDGGPPPPDGGVD